VNLAHDNARSEALEEVSADGRPRRGELPLLLKGDGVAQDASSVDDLEFDLPGDVPQPLKRGAAFEEDPRRRPMDTALAAFSTIAPVVATAAAVYLHIIGWYRISWIEVGILLTMHFVIVTGIELGYHRLFAHASFECSRSVKIALAILGSFSLFGPVIWWCYVHRKHHRYSDRPGDPTSMYLHGEGFWNRAHGFIHAHIGWVWNPVSIRATGWRGYVRDLYRDPDLLKLQMNYLWLAALGFALPAIAGGLLHMTWKGVLLGFLFGGPVRMLFTNHLTYFTINTLSHSVGARPFQTRDKSTNSIPVLFALPTLGQSYHNNHHAFPSSWRVDRHWYELDPAAYMLRGLRMLGLAWGFRDPSPAQVQRKRRRD
jgi:stearoyl-CoA desaturase (delta-9 desaturase)